MSIVNVGDMTREELEEAVLGQSMSLKTLVEVNEKLKASYEKLEGEYDELSSVVLRARQVLQC